MAFPYHGANKSDPFWLNHVVAPHPEWKICQKIEAFGMVHSHNDGLWCIPGIFRPFKGVELSETDGLLQLVNFSHTDQYPIGSWIGFNNVEVTRFNEKQHHPQCRN